MTSRLDATSPEVEALRDIFELHLLTEPAAKDLPKDLKAHRVTPTRYDGLPAWVSGAWFGFLLSRRTTWAYRHPDFEGDYVSAQSLLDQGIRIHEQSAKCAGMIRLPADEVLLMNFEALTPERRATIAAQCQQILNPLNKRDAKAVAKEKK